MKRKREQQKKVPKSSKKHTAEESPPDDSDKVVEGKDDQAGTNESREAAENRCGICLQEGSLSSNHCSGNIEAELAIKLLPHQCSICKPLAWKVCDKCNENLLSRTCPMCNSDYAPLPLYRVGGRSLSEVLDPNLDSQTKVLLTLKMKALESIIPSVNAMCYIPPDGTTQHAPGTGIFYLPNGESALVVKVKLELKEDQPFLLSNRTWNLIEQAVENESENATCKPIGIKEGTKHLLAACVKKGGILYLPSSPEDCGKEWEEMDQTIRQAVSS
eukprot:CAMPEP_0175140366 /NCGR_PEP_ID=MMETSP0087-20121206/11436_1 /TAXON_ID=136419 /ORGANISM="Unknown Unknown, Strain D1" /LENGTH=272 /DNA_ID=CAMNT_0016423515 /DNA_START=178 /DNA_END=999 /DNA_ORIENTATION=-